MQHDATQPDIAGLDGRSIVLVGLMGAGKTSVGRRLAETLGLPFVDSDQEIVLAAGMSIPEIFDSYGETHFRDGERRVIARLLDGPPCVLATGGGAYMSPEVRALVADRAISIWLRADLDTLWDRVRGKPGRPLLEKDDPRGVLAGLMAQRYPVYALADITVDSLPGKPHEALVETIIRALAHRTEASDDG